MKALGWTLLVISATLVLAAVVCAFAAIWVTDRGLSIDLWQSAVLLLVVAIGAGMAGSGLLINSDGIR